MQCWICCKKIHQNDPYHLLPETEDDTEEPKICKNACEIKIIYGNKFLYYILCEYCLEKYLDNYPFTLSKIFKREYLTRFSPYAFFHGKK